MRIASCNVPDPSTCPSAYLSYRHPLHPTYDTVYTCIICITPLSPLPPIYAGQGYMRYTPHRGSQQRKKEGEGKKGKKGKKGKSCRVPGARRTGAAAHEFNGPNGLKSCRAPSAVTSETTRRWFELRKGRKKGDLVGFL
jgi:hypothetical protein